MPPAAPRLIRAMYAHNVTLTMIGGIREMGVATPGLAQRCPLSAALFVLVMDPFVRILLTRLLVLRAGLASLCADDVAILLHEARLLAELRPVFALVAETMGLHRTPTKRQVVSLAVGGREVINASFVAAVGGWHEFGAESWMGPAAGVPTCSPPLTKYCQTVQDIMAASPPAAAAPIQYRVRILPFMAHAATLSTPPAKLPAVESHSAALGESEATPRPHRGHLELQIAWGWPEFPSIELVAAAHFRRIADTKLGICERFVVLFRQSRDQLPLAHFAWGAGWDERRAAPPLAAQLADA